VGNVNGTFDATGKLLSKTLWSDPTSFYAAAPMDYYARFWHERAINGKAYGFPYDDVGGYSSYISHAKPAVHDGRDRLVNRDRLGGRASGKVTTAHRRRFPGTIRASSPLTQAD